jgi:phosphoglycerate dehydrogenase-like enzyme
VAVAGPPVVLTEVAFERYGTRLGDLPSLRMQRDGTLRSGRGTVDWDDARPEVAWATADLFDGEGPVRPFFGLLLRSPALRWLQVSAAGVDHPFFAELLGRGTRLTTSHVTDIPIAEYVLRAVLDHYQDAGRWREGQVARRWEPHDFRELHGTTWLVWGLGAIGTAVAVRAGAFGVRVVGVRRSPTGSEPVAEVRTPAEAPGAVADADVVVLAVPSTTETAALVDAAFLAAMRPGSVLVNVARGALVDEAALLAALDRGVPELAVLDVVRTEPLPDAHPLWTHPRVVLTPHSSAGGRGRFDRAAEVFFDNLGRWRDGEPLVNEVPPGPEVRHPT